MNTRYKLLHEGKACKCLESSGLPRSVEVKYSSDSQINNKRTILRAALPWLLHAILIVTSTTFFVLGYMARSQGQCPHSDLPRMFAVVQKNFKFYKRNFEP